MFPPCAVDGPTLTVRKFTHRFSLEDLVAVGTLRRQSRCIRAPLADVCGLLTDPIAMTTTRTTSRGRLVLVDGTELDWQRARYREGRHLFAPVDPVLVGLNTLQHWLWSRIGSPATDLAIA